MQSEAPQAVDLSQESQATHKLYGLDDAATEKFGRRCLMARRLVERGVRFVQVYSGGGHSDENWDAHGDVDKNHELHCKETDKPMSGLILDLAARGLLDETLIVWCGEFGCTPTAQNGKVRPQPAFSAGWPAAGSKGTSLRHRPVRFASVENKVHVHDFHATILHLMGSTTSCSRIPQQPRLSADRCRRQRRRAVWHDCFGGAVSPSKACRPLSRGHTAVLVSKDTHLLEFAVSHVRSVNPEMNYAHGWRGQFVSVMKKGRFYEPPFVVWPCSERKAGV